MDYVMPFFGNRYPKISGKNFRLSTHMGASTCIPTTRNEIMIRTTIVPLRETSRIWIQLVVTQPTTRTVNNSWDVLCKAAICIMNGGQVCLEIFISKSMIVNKYFQTWHMISWQHSRQTIRSHVKTPVFHGVMARTGSAYNTLTLRPWSTGPVHLLDLNWAPTEWIGNNIYIYAWSLHPNGIAP